MNVIDFGLSGLFFFPFCIEGFVGPRSLFLLGDSLGGLIAIFLLAAGGFVAGGLGDGPLPPGWVPGVASQALSAAFLASITFNPSNICADTSFCFVFVSRTREVA